MTHFGNWLWAIGYGLKTKLFSDAKSNLKIWNTRSKVYSASEIYPKPSKIGQFNSTICRP